MIVRRLISAIQASTDKVMLAALFQRAISTVIGPAQAVLLLTCLTVEQQGYWYVFTGILSISGYAEMGLGQVITQFSAHEWAKSEVPEKSELAHRRLQGIYRITLLWSFVLALLVPAISLPLGWLIIGTKDATSMSIDWHGPWIFVVLASSGALLVAFQNSFLEGCQFLVSTNLRRTIESAATLCGSAIMLTAGYTLWALGTAQFLSVIAAVIWIIWQHGHFIRGMLNGCLKNRSVSWWGEVWPLQWRYAMTWITGMIVFGLFTPVIFRMVGAAEAGRFGFCWSLTMVISGYSQVWISSRVPQFASLNSSERWDHFRQLYKRTLFLSLSSYTVGALALMCAIIIVQSGGFSLSHRLLTPIGITFLLIGQFANAAINAVTILARSFKEEPFVKLAWVNTSITAVLLFPFVYYWRETGAAAAFATAQGITFLLSIRIFKVYWSRARISTLEPMAL